MPPQQQGGHWHQEPRLLHASSKTSSSFVERGGDLKSLLFSHPPRLQEASNRQSLLGQFRLAPTRIKLRPI
jgi:hypothetical protein